MASGTPIRSRCNNCSTSTNHDVLHSEKSTWSEEIDEHSNIYGGSEYFFLRCRGCETVKVLRQSWFSEDVDEQGSPRIQESSIPPETDRRDPEWFHKLIDIFDYDRTSENACIAGLLREIYVACQNDQRRLAAMGVRALLEHIMISKVGDNRTFVENLEKFYEERYISRQQKEILEAVLEVGHATMHRYHHPSKEDLRIIVDILENIVQTVVVHDKEAKNLKSRTPQRTKRPQLPAKLNKPE